MSLENISCQKSFGGWHKRYRHRSDVLGCDMVFAVYLPPQAELIDYEAYNHFDQDVFNFQITR